jgi:hypothetical protein
MFDRTTLEWRMSDGHGVQEGLGGVLVGAVSGVHHARLCEALDELAGAGAGVAHDVAVGEHALHVEDRVHERLALLNRRGAGGEVQRVGREPLFGDFKGGTRPGGVLEEEIHHELSAKRGNLLEGALGDQGHLLGRVENLGDVLGREVFDAEQVFVAKGHGGHSLAFGVGVSRIKASSPSISLRRSSTLSSRRVFKERPT